ncbi:MAG: AAA family ATPase [Propionibacteriaceae bacterium]|jgi:predicted AAA+ superfamily ATPase|nr:AAA family ATPase [Propionibacteriaceae bacterium]
MDRDVMAKLHLWRADARRKPLLLEGPRQVGKTWLLTKFGESAYQNVAFLDFEETPTLRSIFDGDFDAARIISQLQLATGVSITQGQTLIILDEIQACPRALTALKYFHDRANNYHIAAAGSLLGIAPHQQASFPVGKVNFIRVHPLSFLEFLRAIDQADLSQALAHPDWPMLTPFHPQLVRLLRDYLLIGGMPEVVSVFTTNRSYEQARNVQLEILQAYDLDVSKHAPTDEVPRIRSVWASIPAQLAKPQHRFLYNQVGSGARKRSHRAAIDWLIQSGAAIEVKLASVPRLPLASNDDPDSFKLYLADVGLMGALAGLSPTTLLDSNQLFTEFRGSLTEQYAAMQLTQTFDQPPHYWTNTGGSAEVDFLAQRQADVVPVEIKATRNLKAQSLRVYREKYTPDLAVRSSLAPYARHGSLIDLPLYALHSLPDM